MSVSNTKGRQSFVDPLTGDELTFSEKISWRVQGIIRHWTLLIIITLATAGIFTYTALTVGVGLRAGAVSLLTWWNLWASWAALMIEGTVGIAMYSAGRRDSVFIRKIHNLEQTHQTILERQTQILGHLMAVVDAIGSQGPQKVDQP